MPLVQQLNGKYQDRLVVLNIHIGGNAAGVARFMTENNYTILTLIDTDGTARRGYRIQYVPTSYFIDKDGFIRDTHVGAWESLAQIEERLLKIL